MISTLSFPTIGYRGLPLFIKFFMYELLPTISKEMSRTMVNKTVVLINGL